MRYFRIAGLLVEVGAPVLPGSFDPFECEPGKADMSFTCGRLEVPAEKDFVDRFSNDAGRVELYRTDAYWFSVTFGETAHWMRCSLDFCEAEAELDSSDPFLQQVISSMLRIAFSQRIIYFDGLSIHASAVVRRSDSLARLFLGKSGTGKSTHSMQWMKHFDDAWLLNDDNPMLRVVDDRLVAFGSPWSGKTPCYRNASAAVQGLVRLAQGKANSWHLLRASQAWLAIFPSCSFIAQDELLYLQVARTVNFIVTSVTVGNLDCLPDEDAAVVCNNGLSEAAKLI